MRKLISFLFFAAIASQLGATDCGGVLRDPGFDLWCGEELCAWKVERGEIKRVATWHEGDSGVELVGPDTAIAQLSPVDSSDGHCVDREEGGLHCEYPANVCIEFSLLANIDENAVVDLEVDIFGDGTADHVQRLPIGAWQRLEYRIVVGMPFAGIRFALVKSGSGVAQLANIGAEKAKNCDGLPVIEPLPAPLGSPCADASDCASGICGVTPIPAPFDGVAGFLLPEKVCLACDAANACPAGETCGLDPAASPVRAAPVACVPVADKQLGEQCAIFTECESGLCTGNMCSTCDADADCTGGDTCAKAFEGRAPYVCGPGLARRTSGEPCVTNADCASGACLGEERRQCNDGRACASAAQCPFEDGLKNGPCNTVGIQGGICQ